MCSRVNNDPPADGGVWWKSEECVTLYTLVKRSIRSLEVLEIVKPFQSIEHLGVAANIGPLKFVFKIMKFVEGDRNIIGPDHDWLRYAIAEMGKITILSSV